MDVLTPTEREARMQEALIDAARFGQVSLLGPFQAQVVIPAHKINHVLHLLLTIVTAGLWVIVWLVMAAQQEPEERHIVTVDEYGGLWVDDEPRPLGLGQH